jgi:hypothetical protein
MSYTTTMMLMLLTTPLLANQHEQRFKNGVTAYDAAVFEKLPDFVYDMTKKQWYAWATSENHKALLANHSAAYPQGHHVRYKYVTQGGGWSQTRFGGGVGAGGFGGSGGYSGYLGPGDQQSGVGGLRFGAGRPGNSMQTSGGSSSASYTLEFKEWPVFNGGDVPLLNPYVKPQRPKSLVKLHSSSHAVVN